MNSTKLATSLLLVVRLCESNIIFLCLHVSIRAFVVHPSVCHLLNHWAKFNQTCYITTPHGKGVREQHYFFVHLSFIHLSVMPSPPKPLSRIQPHLLHHFPSWLGSARTTLFFCPSVWGQFICPSSYPPKPFGRILSKLAI